MFWRVEQEGIKWVGNWWKEQRVWQISERENKLVHLLVGILKIFGGGGLSGFVQQGVIYRHISHICWDAHEDMRTVSESDDFQGKGEKPTDPPSMFVNTYILYLAWTPVCSIWGETTFGNKMTEGVLDDEKYTKTGFGMKMVRNVARNEFITKKPRSVKLDVAWSLTLHWVYVKFINDLK